MRISIAFWVVAWSCAAAQRPVTIADVVAPPPARAARLAAASVWSPDGKRIVLNERGSLSVYDVKSGKSTELPPMAKMEAAAAKVPAATRFDWTNRNVSEKDVQWFPDNRRLLISAGGDLFVLDTEKKSFEPLTQTTYAERDPKLAPDGHAVSFRVNHNLRLLDLSTKQIQALTTDGSETLRNGEADWVYPEELDLQTAHWWSPDSRSIAYLQFDVAHEPLYPQTSLLATEPVNEPERYPKAGDPNADVRLGVVPASGGATRWVDLGETRGNLLARIAWSPNSRELLAVRMNRVQSKLDVLLADSSTGAAHSIIHEEDPKWINVRSAPAFLSADRFVYMSERSGFFHLYVFGTDGKQLRQLTSGDWEVDDIAGVNRKAGRVFFSSKEASPLERHLYVVSADGTGKRQLTAGEGTHTVSLAPTGDAFVEDYSSLKNAPRSVLRGADGAEIRIMRMPEAAGELDLLPIEVLTMKTADGAELYARLIRPAGFREGVKYPAVVVVYGGPGSQQIHNVWSAATWEQALAHKGFVVWQLDNRGSTGRGHKFESGIYHALGKQELADQKEGIDFLVSKGFVDQSRIGMYGWSYGGFMTLYTATNAPGLLKAAVAGAPVVNWRSYDSIYTERYMGLPEDDPEAYRVTAPLTKAADSKGTRLLLAHNFEDDNVHFQNTMQMANALEAANVPFYMLVYPGKSHGVTGPGRKHLLEQITAFFEENLK